MTRMEQALEARDRYMAFMLGISVEELNDLDYWLQKLKEEMIADGRWIGPHDAK